ncbi:MAG: hypothetical protein ABH811_02720 [archaeon]
MGEEIQKKDASSDEQNKLLKNFLIFIAIFIGVFLVSYIFFDSRKNFEYKGIKFEIVDELAPYRTSIPLYQGNSVTGNFIGDYNFYLRKDPRKIGEKITLSGELHIFENVVFNATQEFRCEGDEIIGIANLASLLERMGARVIKNDSLSCNWDGDYTFIRLIPGNKTEIKMPGPSCYDLYIFNCEVLEVTERLMIEIFKEINKE